MEGINEDGEESIIGETPDWNSKFQDSGDKNVFEVVERAHEVVETANEDKRVNGLVSETISAKEKKEKK